MATARDSSAWKWPLHSVSVWQQGGLSSGHAPVRPNCDGRGIGLEFFGRVLGGHGSCSVDAGGCGDAGEGGSAAVLSRVEEERPEGDAHGMRCGVGGGCRAPAAGPLAAGPVP